MNNKNKSKEVTIFIDNFKFDLKLDSSGMVQSSNFTYKNDKVFSQNDSPEDFKFAQQRQQQIFDGKFDWLINKEKTITLPMNITVDMKEPIWTNSLSYNKVDVSWDKKCECKNCKKLVNYIVSMINQGRDLFAPDILLSIQDLLDKC